MKTTGSFDNCAVFIGVDDYAAYDVSMHLAPGTSNLPGSRNDAAAFWRVCLKMGFAPENMRILTSPRLDPKVLEGGTEASVREANETEINEAISWLADKIGHQGGAPGLLTYSGHGDWLEKEGLVLCPSDTVGPDLDHAISFQRIKVAFAEKHALANLTLFIDCCHSGASTGRNLRRSSLRGAQLPDSLAVDLPRIGARELCAAKPGGSSWQSSFSGVWRGAFSWSMACVMDQWQIRAEGASVELDLSYGELLSRSTQLLTALSFDQEPVLRAAPGVSTMPVFHAGVLTASDQTFAAPNAERYGGQLDPDCKYSITCSSYVNEVLSTGSSIGATYTTTYNPNTEYWSFTQSLLNAFTTNLTSSTTLTLTKTQSTINWQSLGFPTESALSTFGMPSTTIWTKMSASPPQAFYNASIPCGISCNLSAPTSTAPWKGTMTWYLARNSTDAYWNGTGAGAGGTFTYGDRPSTSSGYSWYFVTLTALNWVTSSSIVNIGSTVMGVASTSATSSSNTSLQNKLFLAYTTSKNEVHVRSSTDGVNYSPGADTNALANSGPALAITGGSSAALYMAYRDFSTTEEALHIRYSVDGVNFSSTVDTGSSSAAAPALAVLGSTLFMAYQNTSGKLKVVGTSNPTSASSWQSANAQSVADSITGGPSMVAWNRVLYLVARVSSATINVYSSTDGSTWTTGVPIYQNFRDPTITAFNGRLYIACRDASNNIWVCSSADGTTWSDFNQLTTQLSVVVSTFSPALSAVTTSTSQNLVLAYIDTSSSGDNLHTVSAVQLFS